MSLELPALRRPWWAVWACVLLFVAVMAFSVYQLPNLWRSPELVIVTTATLAIASCWILRRVTHPLAVCIPRECSDVRKTVSTLMSLNYGHAVMSEKSWSADEVWEVIQRIVSDIFCVPREEVKFDTRFVQDLHA